MPSAARPPETGLMGALLREARRWPAPGAAAQDMAAAIIGELEPLSVLLDALCRDTCHWCPTPCCVSARIWFDARDLVFLDAAGLPLPPRQPCTDRHRICCYWTHRGCRLPRLQRPFVCTWYLCPTQRAILNRMPDGTAARFEAGIRRVKALRKKLADRRLDSPRNAPHYCVMDR